MRKLTSSGGRSRGWRSRGGDDSIRAIHAVLIAVTIPLGLASRVNSLPMPDLVREYGGDVLSAVCIFFGVRFVLHRRSIWNSAVIAYVVCVLIELQQLITWSPLRRLREETPLDILLGHGFLWSDLVCYAVGVGLGLAVANGAELLLGTRVEIGDRDVATQHL
jgi:hypothetical protein